MAQIPTTNVSMAAINTEVGSVNSNSLKTLSDNATAGTDPSDGTPYGMGEFRGYTHINNHDVVVSFGAAQGKLGQRTGTITSGANVPFGTNNLSQFFTTDGNNWVRMAWSGGLNTSWTSVELPDGTTFNRTALSVNGYTHGLFPATNAQYTSWSSGTWTFTY